jgi:hypothetical protein
MRPVSGVLLLLLLGGLLLGLATAPVPQASAAVVLDQEYVPTSACCTFIVASVFGFPEIREASAQSFTAGRSGALTQVELLLARSVSTTSGRGRRR